MESGNSGADAGLTVPWRLDVELDVFERTRVERFGRYGAVTRYRTVTTDRLERSVIYAQARRRRRSAASVDLTLGTAPPMGIGTDGMMTHFMLKAVEGGLDVVLFGPERVRRQLPGHADRVREVVSNISLPGSAHALHLIADEVARAHATDLTHMLWSGVSLGALKGILFNVLAPTHGRVMVYSHYAAPVCPDPVQPPTDREYRRWKMQQLGSVARVTSELMWNDLRKNAFPIHFDVMRLIRPTLTAHYGRSAPLGGGGAKRLCVPEWQKEVTSGVAGLAAHLLPEGRLTTFELFEGDGSADSWRKKLAAPITAGTTVVTVHPRPHGDAVRLSLQRRRLAYLTTVMKAIDSGTPVEELTHPAGST